MHLHAGIDATGMPPTTCVSLLVRLTWDWSQSCLQLVRSAERWAVRASGLPHPLASQVLPAIVASAFRS